MKSPNRAALIAAIWTLSAVPAIAGWSPDGATILPTTDHLQPIASCSDGAYGTFVAWQQAPSKGAAGVLRVQHVLSTGDVDPAWPANGLVACNVSIARTMLGALPDRQGGLYLWWKENATLFTTRIVAAAVAPGWPARGRSLGMVHEGSPDPSVIEDGAHGLYAAWVAEAADPNDPFLVMGAHLGPGNTGAGGWSPVVRSLVPQTPFSTEERWPQLALASDGGVFVAYAQVSSDEEAHPTAFRLRRLTAAGANAAGWSTDGLVVHPFDETVIPGPYPISLVSIAPDGRGGLFVLAGNPMGNSSYPSVDARIYRLLGDGTSAADWPASGRSATPWGGTSPIGGGSDASMRVLADGLDGVVFGMQALMTDSPLNIYYRGMSASGAWASDYAFGSSEGHEMISVGAGRTYFASYSADGPAHMWDEIAYVRVEGMPTGGTYSEYHDDPMLLWYGGVSVASSGDGGAVFYWSQVRDRFGLFARRLTPAGEVTGVEPGVTVRGIESIRFIAGSGVRARISVTGSARLDLFDVAGRRVATERFESGTGDAFETTLAGTSNLRSGLFFARLTSGGAESRAKVLVAR